MWTWAGLMTSHTKTAIIESELILKLYWNWRQSILVSPPLGPPLGNFIEGQEHPVIATDVFSVFLCVSLYYVGFCLFDCRDLWSCVYYLFVFYIVFRNYSILLVERVQWFLFGILVMFGMFKRNHCHIISLWFSRYWCSFSLSSINFSSNLLYFYQ